MKTKTEISIEDGTYGDAARLKIEITLPKKVSSIMQKELNAGIDQITKVYTFYRPAAQDKKNG